MTELTLSAELTSVLETEAERSGTTITALVETWLRQHYATLRRKPNVFRRNRLNFI